MSAAVAAAAAATHANRRNSAASTTKKTSYTPHNYYQLSFFTPLPPCHSRYEIIKRQDWNDFVQYLKNHHHAHGQPLLSVRRCSGPQVLGYLKYLDQFGGTKVHNTSCKYYGQAHSSVACSCPLKEAWSSLQGVVERLRAAFNQQYGGSPETNPFESPVVVLYLKEIRVSQAKARGLTYRC